MYLSVPVSRLKLRKSHFPLHKEKESGSAVKKCGKQKYPFAAFRGWRYPYLLWKTARLQTVFHVTGGKNTPVPAIPARVHPDNETAV